MIHKQSTNVRRKYIKLRPENNVTFTLELISHSENSTLYRVAISSLFATVNDSFLLNLITIQQHCVMQNPKNN